MPRDARHGQRALVLASADPGMIPAPPLHDLVIAADSGLDLAESLDLRADLVVGDMDSVSHDALQRAELHGTRITRHPMAKDETDLELAMVAAIEGGATSIHVIVGSGGRVDHSAANLMVLASPRWAEASVSATVGESSVWVVRNRTELPLSPGDPLSILPIGGPARGVMATGLEWPLNGETLSPWEARGVSNLVVSTPVVISVENGVVLGISSPTPTSGHGASRG